MITTFFSFCSAVSPAPWPIAYSLSPVQRKLPDECLAVMQVQLLQATISGYGSSDKARKLLVYLPGTVPAPEARLLVLVGDWPHFA